MTLYGAFANVRCWAGRQPVTEKVVLRRVLGVAGVREGSDELERRVRPATGDEVLTVPEDAQAIYDDIPATDEGLSWIEDSTSPLGRLLGVPASAGTGARPVRRPRGLRTPSPPSPWWRPSVTPEHLSSIMRCSLSVPAEDAQRDPRQALDW
ncbi:hypothetical protein GCM10027445_26460 [Amycolatopsis endophytica]